MLAGNLASTEIDSHLHALLGACNITPNNVCLLRLSKARSARLFDRQPVLKALIGPDFVKLPKCLETVVNAFLGGASLYVPAPLLPRSVTSAVQFAFRFPVRRCRGSPLHSQTQPVWYCVCVD